MTREEVMNSVVLKERFCKDCNLPITVFDNPYFYERLEVLDIAKDCISKFDEFCDELQGFSDEKEYFKYYNNVKHSIINSIKSNPEYQGFVNASCNCHLCALKQDLYSEQNDDCFFISIDMKKANFSAMKYYSEGIFEGCETWERYVSKFTNSKHIMGSKYIRQVILGACNPKKQIQYEYCLMNILCDYIMRKLSSIKIYSLDSDEILIEVPDKGYDFSLNELRDIVSSCPYSVGELVRVEYFHLDNIGCGWMKTYCDSERVRKSGEILPPRVEFKCVDAEIYHQVLKHYCGKPITDNDLVFYHNGKLARFVKKIENPFI